MLAEHKIGSKQLELGGAMVLGDVIQILEKVAKKDPAFAYGDAFARHLKIVIYLIHIKGEENTHYVFVSF